MARQKQRKNDRSSTLYNATTDPILTAVTAPLPRLYPTRPLTSQQQWQQRGKLRPKRTFIQALVDKFNKLLGFALILLFLLLAARFALTLFDLTTSLFSQWVFLLSKPLVTPFSGLLPTVVYQGYPVEWPIICAFIVYSIAALLVSRFLKVLVD